MASEGDASRSADMCAPAAGWRAVLRCAACALRSAARCAAPSVNADAPGASPRSAAFNKARQESQRRMMVPLLYAPLLPLIRLGLRQNPPLRDAVFGAAVGTALLHAGYIMFGDSSV